jgi:acyl carrier protein
VRASDEAGTCINPVTIAKLRNWIISSNQKAAADIGIDTQLINEGMLDSLQMVNFLLYIEELRGREIPEALIQPECFASLRVIHDTFFAEREHERGGL